ncbi:hypothetical protein E2C01_017113 [Portunus trituberculatus]|uniref:Uncharacterized protein n=1 Tax=Portunus trituberculatus TaxID=210409 RepID=A0A5B7DSQ4_PORTR|nr:hypothetical protein [Portunus trituberculatus]
MVHGTTQQDSCVLVLAVISFERHSSRGHRFVTGNLVTATLQAFCCVMPPRAMSVLSTSGSGKHTNQ